jgi:hypothetical protein
MENIKKHLEQAENKLRLEWQEKEKSVLDDIEKTKKEIADLAKSGGFSPYAIIDFVNEKLEDGKETHNLPELIRIGRLNPVNFDGKMPEIPMLLPFSENAVSFSLNDDDKRNVHTVFELIAFRLMLSLPQNLSKFYFVDNIGGGFARINKIDKKIPDYYRITDNEQDRNKLFADLEQIVSDFNREHKAKFNSLIAYNKTAEKMQKPYHFVFIPNFPVGFKTEAAEKLYDFINNGSAAKAGVFIFFGIDKNETPPYGVDIDKFSKSTTCISQHAKSECKIASSIFTGDFNYKFNIILDKSLPPNIDHIIDLINQKEVKKAEVSFEKDYKERLRKGDFWKENKSTIDNVKIPIGKINPQEDQYLVLGKDRDGGTNDYFGLIGGLSGYGKTVLLHNIILWGAIEYSPFELEYYLIDCKNGTGFKPYQDLPHTKILSMSNDREFALSSMTTLVSEMNRREVLFRDANVNDIHTYRETGKKMPRILAIIDEFQVLFENEDKIARTIRDSLNTIFTRGRASGINVLLCSQKIGRVDLPVTDITWRLAFRLKSEFESQRILLNDSALKLTTVGNAIINNQNGDKKEDINFQVGNVIEKTIKENYIDPLNEAFAERYPNKKIEDKFISDGDNSARIERNSTLKNNIISNSFKVNDSFCDIYIGEPAFIRNEHAKIRIRKQAGSNIIMVGSDIKSAISMIGLINYQLIKQSTEQSKFYIIDCFNIDNEYSGCFNFAKPYFNDHLFIHKARKIDSVIDEIEKELLYRMEMDDKDEIVDGRIVLSVVNMQNCQALEKEKYKESPVTEKLVKIIKKGADYGIHVLLYSLTYQGVTDILDTSILNRFESRIALDSGKSMSIITEQTGTKITEEGTALLQILQPPKGFMTYNPDLFRVYSQCNIDKENADADFIVELLKIGL